MTMSSLVVIPAWNEERTILGVVRECAAYCDVLVIDDGSNDGTSQRAFSGGAVVISNGANKGYEYSLNVGYQHALAKNYDLLITIDGDGEIPTGAISQVILGIEQGAGVVVGKRPRMPRICERLLSHISSRLSTLSDPYCGLKAYNLAMVKNKVFSTYNSFGTSLALDYIELGFRCKNVDIDIVPREDDSRFGGRLTSEVKLIPSLLISSYRLVKNYIKKSGDQDARR